MRGNLWYCGLLVGLTLVAAAQAAEERPNSRGSVTVYFENDIFGGTDRYYTNGFRISWVSPDVESFDLSGLARQVHDRVPWFHRDGYTNNLGLALGQAMYTPVEVSRKEPILDDRPYAGWLYLALSLHHKSTRDVHIAELQLGIVGPESMAEQTQDTVHRLKGTELAEGWDNQLGTEPGINLAYEYRWRMLRAEHATWWGADLLHSAGASVGNVLTEANTGLIARIGYNLPQDFQGNRIRVTGYAQLPDGADRRYGAVSAYLFAGAMGHAVAHDIFLDGNTFRDSQAVDKRPFYAEGEVGVAIQWRRLRLSYTHLIVGKQFDQQHGTQDYGSLNLTVAF